MTDLYYGEKDLDRAVAAIGQHDDLAVLSTAQARVLAQAVFQSAELTLKPERTTFWYVVDRETALDAMTRKLLQHDALLSAREKSEQMLDAAIASRGISVPSGSTSDGFHTFDELYRHRMLLSAALWNGWANRPGGPAYDVHKSLRHSDGTVPFPNDDGTSNWFIVVAELPAGQVSYHYQRAYWDLFASVPVRTVAAEFDGHTSADVTDRLLEFLVG